jgi:UDP-glucuronate decarboxylase
MKWLTDDIATAAYSEVIKIELGTNVVILDVRDLVDKSGNDLDYIISKVNFGLELLKGGCRIIVCCDYGMSRSNSIAVGIIVKFYNVSFSNAVDTIKSKVEESGVKVEMLNTVYKALFKLDSKVDQKKSILITGSSGFLGKSILKKLSSKYSFVAPSSKQINLLTDSISLDLLIKEKNINKIVHLANPKIFTTNGALGDTLVMLKNILDVCRSNDVTLIYLSGWEIYGGYQSSSLLAGETLPANAKGTYGETKWLCELLIKQYISNYNLKCQILRAGPVYGVDAEKPKFIFNFIDKALTHSDIITHRYINGFPSLDLLYIEDLVNLIDQCLKSDFLGDFNIGSGSAISTHQIAEIISNKLNSRGAIRFTEIKDYAPNIIMDTAKIRSYFQWKPKMLIEKGLDIVIENYQLINK